jgi:hypothetical protein
MGMFVAEAAGDPVAVGIGSPGVAVKLRDVPAAVCVRAEAVYSPFKVANVSGVAEFVEKLHAN